MHTEVQHEDACHGKIYYVLIRTWIFGTVAALLLSPLNWPYHPHQLPAMPLAQVNVSVLVLHGDLS